MPQIITLRLANNIGTPVPYPGTEVGIQVNLVSDVEAVWIGVSSDGSTNQVYPLTTPISTILLTYPRIYGGISMTYNGNSRAFFNGLEDYNHRVAACCAGNSDDGSPSDSGESASDSASGPAPEPPPFQLQMMFNGSQMLVTFGMLAGSTSAFVDWGDGSDLEQIDNEGESDQIIFNHTYASPGFYNARAGFVEPELVTNAVINSPAPDPTFTSWLFDATFAAWFNLDLNSQQIEQLEITNLPALTQLAVGGGNLLTSQNVDDLLIALDNAGLNNGFFDTTGQSPAAPPGAPGLAAKANLEGKGWTIVTD